jgi:hypothetical protein
MMNAIPFVVVHFALLQTLDVYILLFGLSSFFINYDLDTMNRSRFISVRNGCVKIYCRRRHHMKMDLKNYIKLAMLSKT